MSSEKIPAKPAAAILAELDKAVSDGEVGRPVEVPWDNALYLCALLNEVAHEEFRSVFARRPHKRTRIEGDEIVCADCGRRWDADDLEPPPCTNV